MENSRKHGVLVSHKVADVLKREVEPGTGSTENVSLSQLLYIRGVESSWAMVLSPTSSNTKDEAHS